MLGLHKESEKHIFDHYLNVTATEIAGRILPLNPFVSHLVPVAYQDTRVVACLLALSGAHLSTYKDGRFEHDARSYYAVTLRAVKHGLLAWKEASTQDLISLFIVILSLCWFEVRVAPLLKPADDCITQDNVTLTIGVTSAEPDQRAKRKCVLSSPGQSYGATRVEGPKQPRAACILVGPAHRGLRLLGHQCKHHYRHGFSG